MSSQATVGTPGVAGPPAGVSVSEGMSASKAASLIPALLAESSPSSSQASVPFQRRTKTCAGFSNDSSACQATTGWPSGSTAIWGSRLRPLASVKPLPVADPPSSCQVTPFHRRTSTAVLPSPGSSSQASASCPLGPAASEGLKEPLSLLLTPPAPPLPAPPGPDGTAGPTASQAEPFQRVT